jgi:hypothetical protein
MKKAIDQMKIRQLVATISLIGFASFASADFEPWKDYEVSESVTSVTTVKVDANMVEKYLEGISKSWATAQEIRKELGHIEDYWVSVSQLQDSGDFNVVLGIRMSSAADMQPSKEKYDAFMEKWGEENEKRSDELVQTYPEIREIVGEYLLRSVTFK